MVDTALHQILAHVQQIGRENFVEKVYAYTKIIAIRACMRMIYVKYATIAAGYKTAMQCMHYRTNYAGTIF